MHPHCRATVYILLQTKTTGRALSLDITEWVRAEEEAQEHPAELRKMVNLMAGREVRMAELKKVIKKLHAQLEEAGLEPAADDPLLAGD